MNDSELTEVGLMKAKRFFMRMSKHDQARVERWRMMPSLDHVCPWALTSHDVCREHAKKCVGLFPEGDSYRHGRCPCERFGTLAVVERVDRILEADHGCSSLHEGGQECAAQDV